MIQQHGGNISRLENILDFSANINPLGLPENVNKALAVSIPDVEKYPDPYCTELRERLGLHENISPENIVCGNGADDIIFRIVHAFKPKTSLVCAPAFSEYSRGLNEADCEIIIHKLSEENDFDVTEKLIDDLTGTLDMCFICTPNNPTGRLIAPDILKMISEKCEKNDTLLLCDECFLGFAEDGEKYSLRNFMNRSSVILKAFTKLFAMPGIRLGYAVCGDPSTAERIQNSGQFWSVSALAQKAGIAALDEKDHLLRTADFIREERSFLTAELNKIGVRTVGSAANFLLFKGSNGLCEKMLSEGILIRDCRNFSGLGEGYYRIAVRTRDDNIRLITALRRCLNG